MEWTFNGATIGYNAGGDYFQNHPNTESPMAHEIACLNPDSVWNNVAYKISVDIEGTHAPPPTVEPGVHIMHAYMDYIDSCILFKHVFLHSTSQLLGILVI